MSNRTAELRPRITFDIDSFEMREEFYKAVGREGPSILRALVKDIIKIKKEYGGSVLFDVAEGKYSLYEFLKGVRI